MAEIKTADVVKLRKTTGAGMMNCKRALQEANGDFNRAIEIIRKKGQVVASKRADRETTEGVVLAKTSEDAKTGAMIVLNCETDFVAKNQDFIDLAQSILDLALEKGPANLEELKSLELERKSITDLVVEKTGIIGEKINLAFFSKIEAGQVTAYIHPGNQLASIVGLNKEISEKQVGKDMAMQVASMNPIAVDKDQIPQQVIDKEFEIGKEQAKREGKPENILDKIAMGKLNKFFKESTLLNQTFIKDNKITVRQYLQNFDKELTVTGFVRYGLKD